MRSRGKRMAWVDAEAVAVRSGDERDEAPLTTSSVASWRDRGFTFVESFLPSHLLVQARDDALGFYPAPGSRAADDIRQFGSGQRFVFPAVSDACNQITLHPRLLAAVAQLLGVEVIELRLTQSDLWPKYGRPPSGQKLDNADQRIHCDYPNHTLTHPPRWDSPEAVEIIIYLSEVAECEGSTAVVPRRGADDPAYRWPIVKTPGVAGFDYVNDRESAERYLRERDPNIADFRANELYAREVKTRYRFGEVLLYRHDTWHRGTPMREGALRLVHNLTFRKAASDWIGVIHPGWAWSMYKPNQPMEKLIAGATIEQRAVLGFPPPGHAYWSADTVEAVAARYAAHGMDIEPYRRSLSER